MIDDDKLTYQQQQNKYGLTVIADIIYMNKINLLAMQTPIKKLQASVLKDICIYFVENQNQWLNKILRAAKEYGRKNNMAVAEALEKDINSDELGIYYAILDSLKQATHMEIIATLISYINEIKEFPEPEQDRMFLWLKNLRELNK